MNDLFDRPAVLKMDRPTEHHIVQRAPQYNKHPSGIECIEIAEHMTFNLGNAFKYGWRYNDKGDPAENLQKGLWYLRRSFANDTAFLTTGRAADHFHEIMSTRRRAFNRPSPWCEPVRHALAAICDMHYGVGVREMIRLHEKAALCLTTAISDEQCLGRGQMP